MQNVEVTGAAAALLEKSVRVGVSVGYWLCAYFYKFAII